MKDFEDIIAKIKCYYEKFAQFMEKIGLKLSIAFLIYTALIAFIAVQLDRLYIKIKLEDAVSKVASAMDWDNSNNKQEKTKKKKWFAPKPQKIELNNTISNEELFEATFLKARFTNRLNPPKTKDDWYIYSYYEPKDRENTLIDIVVDLKNLDKSEVNADSVIQSAKIVYDSKYEYDTYFVFETSDGYDLESSTTINPLQTKKVHILAEVPKIAKSDDKVVFISLDIDGNEYELTIQKTIKSEEKKTAVLDNAKKSVNQKSVNTKQSIEPKIKTSKSTKNIKATTKNTKTPSIKEKSDIESAREALFN